MLEPEKLDPVYLNSRRETVFVIVAWVVFCIWVVGYSVKNGYDIDPSELKTVMGVPAWIFWGVALPWLMANVVAIWFAIKFMVDDPLEDEATAKENNDPAAKEASR